MKIFKLAVVYSIALAIASMGVGSLVLPKASAAGTTKAALPNRNPDRMGSASASGKVNVQSIRVRKAGKGQQ
jgi:hypothetical protein